MKRNAASSLDKIQAIVNQCDRCGACLSVCPVYADNHRETAVARGKLATVRAMIEGGITADSKIVTAFEFCLLCKACTENCPSKVKTDEVMIEARQYTAEKLGRRIKHQFIAVLLGNNVLIRLTAGTLKLSRKAGLNGLLRSVVPIEHTKNHFQEMAMGPAAFPSFPELTRPKMPHHARIAYFQGCAMKMFFPAASQATMKLLNKTAEVITSESVCCGMPQLVHGMANQAYTLAKKNIVSFANVDRIITDCASCGSSLKEYGHRLAADPQWAERAQEFSQKVMGLSEYLYEIDYQPNRKSALKVTYHDPCHLVRGQGIKKQPRELLKRVAEYVEMPQADKCCGGAGTFYLDFPETAQNILAEKVKNIKGTDVDVVVTECPACLMQLAKGKQQSGYFEVMHISQVLGMEFSSTLEGGLTSNMCLSGKQVFSCQTHTNQLIICQKIISNNG
ncbi:(Fe-S)-binding protein [Desulfosporosinus fructosivorans]|uniref:(Fe-S)-binding protein n=1 Tax=Desulfosporosinus fructosivorans TaxID=2018669 RepID=UPI00130DBE06|nr:(Fe-S)-binding protein [Desulfosporosinus fructosivorans]